MSARRRGLAKFHLEYVHNLSDKCLGLASEGPAAVPNTVTEKTDGQNEMDRYFYIGMEDDI